MVLFIEILLIGVGLSMDAFAVSICKGLGMNKGKQKAGADNRSVFRRISGAHAVYRLYAGHPL